MFPQSRTRDKDLFVDNWDVVSESVSEGGEDYTGCVTELRSAVDQSCSMLRTLRSSVKCISELPACGMKEECTYPCLPSP